MNSFSAPTPNHLLEGLNENQIKAVTTKNTPLLVLAGAGSGKTKVLTHRAAYFVHQGLVNAQNVLLLTFTNKAAAEMKDRISLLTREALGFAGTFHSFCVKILRSEAKNAGVPQNFVIYDEDDQKELVSRVVKSLNMDSEKFRPSEILNYISEAKNNMVTPYDYEKLAQGTWQMAVSKIYKEYERLLRRSGALDFDDLLLRVVEMLATKDSVLRRLQEKFNFVLVDEWQDTNKIQYMLTKLMVSKQKKLTVVGDASQSIYSWRGADYKNINYLIKEFPEITIINLEQNYRSTQIILDAANSIIQKNSSHPILSLWTNKKGGQKIKVYQARSEIDEALFVVEEIHNLLIQGCNLNDIAILYRTNAQSRVIEERMLHAGMPYIVVGGVKFYARREIKDILSFLRLLANPHDSVSKKRVEKLGKRISSRFDNFADKLDSNWQEETSTLDIMDAVVQATGYLSKFKRQTEENLARIENINELRSVAASFSNIHEFLENVLLVESEQEKRGLLSSNQSEKGTVTLMTLHAAKGLEFKIVFIIGMEEGIFPHSRTLFDPDQIEEERRLAYVGITRAKEILYLTYAQRRLYFGKRSSNPPSRFLIDIPAQLIESVVDQPQSFQGLSHYNNSGKLEDLIYIDQDF
jgi:DNA helicase-2/ATP-dependent DNA helicase PcrA